MPAVLLDVRPASVPEFVRGGVQLVPGSFRCGVGHTRSGVWSDQDDEGFSPEGGIGRGTSVK